MYEVQPVRQDDPGLFYRWFTTGDCDLYIWQNKQNCKIERFQFCFDRNFDEKVVEWRAGSRSLWHASVDDGGAHGLCKASPLLCRSEEMDLNEVLEAFQFNADGVDENIRQFIVNRFVEKL